MLPQVLRLLVVLFAKKQRGILYQLRLPSCLVGRGAAQASAQLFSRGQRASADWSPTLLPGDVATSCRLGIVDAVSDIQN